MPEIAGPATGAGLHKGPDPLGLAGKGPVCLELGHLQSNTGQATAQGTLSPIQAGLLELRGMTVGTQGVLRHQVQVLRDKVEDFLIPEPAGRLAVEMAWWGRRCRL